MNEEYIKIYFVKSPRGYLKFGTGGYVFFKENIGDADSFSSEASAQSAIGLVSRFNRISNIIDCTVICGEFVPKEGFKAIELVLKIGRWKKLFDMLVKNCTVTDLLLFTGAESPKKISEHPIYEHISKIKAKGFDHWGLDKSSYAKERDESFNCFKLISKYAMNEKFKLNQKSE